MMVTVMMVMDRDHPRLLTQEAAVVATTPTATVTALDHPLVHPQTITLVMVVTEVQANPRLVTVEATMIQETTTVPNLLRIYHLTKSQKTPISQKQ